MREIYAVALNTFREAIRNRIFLALLVFMAAMLVLVITASSASLNQEVRLMKDIGLFLTSSFAVAMSVFVGVSLFYKEIERKTIYTIVPKPIRRWQFLVGKFLGVVGTGGIHVLVMGLMLLGLLAVVDAVVGLEMVQALWLVYVEVLVVTAAALFFSSFSTPVLSGLLTMGLFVVGRFVDDLRGLRFDARALTDNPALADVQSMVRGMARVLPDLSLFNTTPYVVHDQALPEGYVLHASLYGLLCVFILLTLASGLFSRRDFT